MRWRSVLFVPGNRPDLAAKARGAGPDVVVIDLEDAVPADAKAEARAALPAAFAELAGRVPVCVRVNPPATEWFADDLASLPGDVTAVVVPKLELPLDLGVPVVAGLETVRGVAGAGDVLGGAVVACYFGAEDYVADLGGVRTPSNMEVLYARSAVGIAARLAGVPALDMVTLDFGDATRFRGEAAEARALGFAGKLCIHPAQVPLANQAFLPSPAEVERARRLLDAYEGAGGTTIAFEGQMVDEVVAVQARRTIERADG